MSEPKPREWWIEEAFVGEESGVRYPALVAKAGDTRIWKGIHVIEYSAFEELRKELAEMTALKDKAAEIAIAIGFEHNQKVSEIDALKAERDEIADCWQRMKNLYDGLLVEHKQTEATCERYRAALEKIADPRKRDHKEPDAYTTLGCVMNIAEEALSEGDK